MPDPVPAAPSPASLLLIRPEDRAHRFALALRGVMGRDPRTVISPLMRILPLGLAPAERALADGARSVILTSEAAVTHGAALVPAGVAAFCVGERTAAAARAAGLAVAGSWPDAASLAAEAPLPAGAGLHLRGRHVAADLGALLAPRGVALREIVVYDQQSCPLTAEAQALLRGQGSIVVPLFSPRSARLLAEAGGPAARGRLHLVALSPAVKAAAEPLVARGIVLAERPDASAMLEAVRHLLDVAAA